MPSRRLDPVVAYYILTGGYTLFFTIVISVNLLFQTQEAGLSAFQLGLVGAALEAAILLGEVPTGVVADVYGRRRSILIGLALVGVGLMLNGAFAEFGTIMFASFIWGVGYTFISGAQQAWIADEIGVQRVGAVYIRSTQVENLGQIAGLTIGIYIATFDLNTPIILGGACIVLLGAVLAGLMPENGFQRRTHDGERPSRRHLVGTFLEGGRLVRSSPLLMTVFTIMLFYGMASEGFDRLWVKLFTDELHFPTSLNFEKEFFFWFWAIRVGAAVLGIVALEYARRRVNTASHKAVSRYLFAINIGQVVSVLALASAGGFTMGMAAFWTTVTLSRMWDPLYLAWLNQNIESRVRATVISMNSQMNAAGQIAGGPLLGGIGSLISLRAAIYGAAIALLPAAALFTRAFGQGAPELAADVEPEREAGPVA
ncbi:MAG TPA: MFS transporter [Dehalococcoidia bacterium]|nr:MFS transporter [Dehalococcoidia bacterium]